MTSEESQPLTDTHHHIWANPLPKDNPRSELIRAINAYSPYGAKDASAKSYMLQMLQEASCFERSFLPGHFTASAWVVNRERSHCLLTHHRKLNIWVQPGGHADGNPQLKEVALRELVEETGITSVRGSSHILDLDVHDIPASAKFPAHQHLDVRFLCETEGTPTPICSAESHEVRWVTAVELPSLQIDDSVLRMAIKSGLIQFSRAG